MISIEEAALLFEELEVAIEERVEVARRDSLGPLDFLVPVARCGLLMALGSWSVSLASFAFSLCSLTGPSRSTSGTGEEARDFWSQGCAVSGGWIQLLTV